MTNKLIALAGAMSLGITAAHVFGGGSEVHDPLLQSELSTILKGYVSVIWHSVTATLLITSSMLLVASVNRKIRKLLTWLVIIHYLAFIGLFLFYGIFRLGSMMEMPPWIGFIVIILVAFAGLLKDYSPAHDSKL